jgi:hypothetical protein
MGIFGGLFLAILLGCYICYNEIRHSNDKNDVYSGGIYINESVLKDLNDRLITLEIWAGDGPEISAAMDSDEDKE